MIARVPTFPLLAAVLAIVGCGHAQAQSAPPKWADTISTEIEKAVRSGDLAKVQAARALAERVATAYPDDGLILHYEGFALYEEAGIRQGRSDGDPNPVLERARDLLDRSLKNHPLPETHALLSSIDGQLIARDPSRAMELGMAAQSSMGAAVSLGPKNPRVWLLRGISTMFTPAEYGGGLKPAEEQIQHAIELFATDKPNPGEPSWGRAEAYIWLGQLYEKLNDKPKAEAAYKSALQIAPDYRWATMLLAALKQ